MRLVFSIIGFTVMQIFFIIRNIILFSFHAAIIYFISQYLTSKKITLAKYKIIYNILAVMFVELLINVFVVNIYWTLIMSYVLFYVLSLGFYFLHLFRGNSLYFADIFCIGTAKEVAGGYKYDIKPQFILSLILTMLVLSIFRSTVNMVNNLFVLFRLALAFFNYMVLRLICSQNAFNYALNAGETDGYIFNFISSCPIFYISINDVLEMIKDAWSKLSAMWSKHEELSVVEKSTTDNSKEIEASLDAPHVIVIMNESFSHINERINTNMPVTPVYDNLNGVLKGNLLVNTFGGGTETTEFEFLTGMHVGCNPYPIYPYNQIKTKKDTMARFFALNGYRTMAMHPYTATNYHRNVIYNLFDFKEMFFYDDFKHRDTVRNYVSDEAMYEEVIDKYEETKKDNKKLFLFGITMQNHSGYDTFDGQGIEVLDDYDDKKSLNSYLSLLHISDKSIDKLIKYFDKENERVLICFFGDHNASFSPETNKMIYDLSNSYEGKNVYETPFFIYDNKNKNDEVIKQISTNFLGLELIKRTGLLMNDYYKMLDNIYDRVYYMNFHKEKSRKDNLMYNIVDIENEYMAYKDAILKY